MPVQRDETVFELTLWIEQGSEPVSGHLADRRGEVRSFCGWIELLALLEEPRLGSWPRTTAADSGQEPRAP